MIEVEAKRSIWFSTGTTVLIATLRYEKKIKIKALIKQKIIQHVIHTGE